MKRLCAIGLLAASLGQTGCASVYTAFIDDRHEDIYGGTRLDTSIIASHVSSGQVACGLPNCEERSWLFVTGAFSDLPLSLIGDTLLLPYTLTASLLRDAPEGAD